MRNIKVALIGSSGMLGSMVLDAMHYEAKFELIATVRGEELIQNDYKGVEWRVLNAEETDVESLAGIICDASWIINNIGIIKPYIHDDNPQEIEMAIAVNSLFPHKLARAAALKGSRVLQIATDCVYSGAKGQYVESDLHDALDVYGKTKSLGEVFLPHVNNLRCSIIGPEPKSFVSLLEWFRRQPDNAQVNGFTNHQWNGVTTLHFARLCKGIIEANLKLPHVQHVVPSGTVSKAELLQCFAREFNRHDITINPVEAKTVINRTLVTNDEDMNRSLWSAAGYSSPPSVPQMVAEMAEFINNR